MGAITEFLETFDISKLLPALGEVISDLRLWVTLFLLVGPIVMLILGLWYFFLPTKEANHHIGFRTYYGMGSPSAWKYTQRMAGWLYMIGGFVLTVVTIILAVQFGKKDPVEQATSALIFLLVQAGIAFGLWVAVQVLVIIRFNLKGEQRSKSPTLMGEMESADKTTEISEIKEEPLD